MASLSDAELVARCRAGDSAAWNELVERFSRYVYAIAIRVYALERADAEDVFQEVFGRVYERLGTLRSDEAIRSWIGRLTRNCCVDRLRDSKREVALAEIEERADAGMERLDEAFAVRQCMARLSPECRQVLDRFFCRDESYRTIGAALDLPAGTIASRISRCLARLREELETNGDSSRKKHVPPPVL